MPTDPCRCLTLPPDQRRAGFRCDWCVNGILHSKNDLEIEAQRLRRLLRTALANTQRSETCIPRWSKIADLLDLGCTAANELCAEFGINPHERIPMEGEGA